MVIGWLIYREEDAAVNHSYIEWFKEEARKKRITLELIYREKLTFGTTQLELCGNKTMPPDFAIVRTIEPLLQFQFEQMKIPVFNNFHTASICNHKSFTYSAMTQLKVPVMPSVFIASRTIPDQLPFSFPFILKEAASRGGAGVHFIESQAKWRNILMNLDKDFVAQSAENIQFGKDVRVFVIGNEMIAAVLRSNETNFRANYKLGGNASLFHLTPVMKKMVQKIIDHFNFGMVGIDFLLSVDGDLVFNEIEDVVGSRILSLTTDINLLEKYVHHINKLLHN